MPSEKLWLCDPGRTGRGLSTGLWLRADVPCAVTDELHFHCHPCFILMPFPEHPRLRGTRFGSVFSFFSTSEAVWGLHLKVLVHPAEGNKEGCPRHKSNASRQTPKGTCMEHHPIPAAQSCLEGPHTHLSPRCAVGAGSLLQAHYTASPWGRHSPRADMDAFPFKTLLLLLLPQPHGVGFQPRRSRGCFASPAQEKEQHWGEGDVPSASPTPGRGTAPTSHHCPLSPFAASKGTSYAPPRTSEKNNLVWEDFGSYKDSSSIK